MFNTIIITVKTLLRRPSTWVWGAIFPIALSTMFMFMFANLSSDGKVDPVPVAVVADEAWDASTFKDVATSLAKEGDDQLLEIHECDDAADANRALKAGEVAGIYTVDDAVAGRQVLGRAQCGDDGGARGRHELAGLTARNSVNGRVFW